jgi:hypothetical protein
LQNIHYKWVTGKNVLTKDLGGFSDFEMEKAPEMPGLFVSVS